ncbi:hypothetical protein ACFLV3_03255 [Chloroflexota bacterium]
MEDWPSILLGIIAALVAAIGIPLARRKRKEEGPKNMEQLFYHLQGIGVKTSMAERGVEEEKVGLRRSSAQRSEGAIKVEGKNIDFINVSSVASQYGVKYFIDYLVRIPNWTDKRQRKKTSMVKKKSSGFRGRVIDIQWKGDDYLSRELNYDYHLQDKLVQSALDNPKSSIQIVPESKYEYARVITPYLLPPPDLFEAIDIIAKHIKSGW